MFIPKVYKTQIESNTELYDSYIVNRMAFTNLLTSNYDITKKCDMSCDGCYFFEGDDYLSHSDNSTLEEWDIFFAKEKKRGISFPYIAGAEPSLVQDRLKVANKHFSKGAVFTNGSSKIDENINFKIHISVWGTPEKEKIVRKDSFFIRALENYKNDQRAVFVYTIHAQNINDIETVIKYCKEYNAKLTFNFFSPTTDYLDVVGESNEASLILEKEDLLRIRNLLDNYIDIYGETLVYNKAFNQWITNPKGLYEVNKETNIASDCLIIKQSDNLHFRTDFSFNNSKCCFPNMDCNHCRAYAVALGSAISKYSTFFKSYEGFVQWNSIASLWRNLFLMEEEN